MTFFSASFSYSLNIFLKLLQAPYRNNMQSNIISLKAVCREQPPNTPWLHFTAYILPLALNVGTIPAV